MARATSHRTLLKKLARHDMAVDLGTANTLIYTVDDGIVLNQPSVVCFERHATPCESTLAAVGSAAKQLLGRTPANLETVRPLQHGVIANVPAAQQMIRSFVDMACPRRLFGRRATFTICVPAGATNVERRAIREAAFAAGAASVHLIGELLASAVGAGVPVASATASMVVDIGGGTTEVGMIAHGSVVCGGSARVGGDQFDLAIINHVRNVYGVMLGEQTAEHVKKTIGTALRNAPVERMRATGRSLEDSLPRTVELTSHDVADALVVPLRHVIDAVRAVLETAPPELVTDVAETGIVLTGGGALLANLDACLSAQLCVPVRVADEPMTCAVRGAGAAASLLDEYAFD